MKVVNLQIGRASLLSIRMNEKRSKQRHITRISEHQGKKSISERKKIGHLEQKRPYFLPAILDARSQWDGSLKTLMKNYFQ